MIRLLSLFLLCSCGDISHNAGQSAAYQMGVSHYVSFMRHGQPDSAALFFWRGNWRLYHPSMGSMKTIYDDPASKPLVAVLVIEGATGPISWKHVESDAVTNLPNGCLPRAISRAGAFGGGISITPNHASYVR